MIIHKELAMGRWFNFTLMEQLANVGTDVSRAIRWKNKREAVHSQNALYRALELLCLTADDPKNRKRLREIVRMREVLLDYFVGDNQFSSTDEQWEKYFYQFNYAAALARGR